MLKPALGKGLSALINTRVASPTPIEADGERVQMIALDQIVASPWQPRTEFRDDLRSLTAASPDGYNIDTAGQPIMDQLLPLL